MSETLETKARRIGDDITAVWDLIQARGGLIPHTINTENLADVINQIQVTKYGAKGAYFYDANGMFYTYYTTHEINRMESLPETPQAGQEWTTTLASLKNDLENNDYALVGVVLEPAQGSTTMHMNLTNSSYLAPSLRIKFSSGSINNRIYWGDGTSTIVEGGTSYTSFSHTYSGVGEYDIVISTDDGIKVTLGGEIYSSSVTTRAMKNVFGEQLNQLNNTDNSRYSKYLESVIIGENATMGPGAFMHCSYYNYDGTSGLKSVTLPEGLEIIPDFAFAGTGLVSISLPSTLKTIGMSAFANCQKLELNSLPSGVVRLCTAAFFYCKKISFTQLPSGVLSSGVALGAFGNSGVSVGFINYVLANTLSLGVHSSVDVSWSEGIYSYQNASSFGPPYDKNPFLGIDVKGTQGSPIILTFRNDYTAFNVGYFSSNTYTTFYFPDGTPTTGISGLVQSNRLTLDVPNKKLYASSRIVSGQNYSITVKQPEYDIYGTDVRQLTYMFNGDSYSGAPLGTSSGAIGLFNLNIKDKVKHNFQLQALGDITPAGSYGTVERVVTFEEDVDFSTPPGSYSSVSISYGFGNATKIIFKKDIISNADPNKATFGNYGLAVRPVYDASTPFEYLIDMSHITSVPSVASNITDAAGSYPLMTVTSNITPKCVVPDALYNDFINHNKWGLYAQYIVRASQA